MPKKKTPTWIHRTGAKGQPVGVPMNRSARRAYAKVNRTGALAPMLAPAKRGS